jgi:hypothetical protein
VEIITYALMSNHFHILVRVPAKAAADAALTEGDVLDRMSEFRSDLEMGILKTGANLAREMRQKQEAGELVDEHTRNWGENWLAVRESVVAQMHEVSHFMKLFKQRVGIWFNKSKGTYGTLWADRFKSQLVQDGGQALRTVAAYIDLNGVRAGQAQDPKDYRFCGYAEALAGNEALQQQYARIEWAAASKPSGEKADLKAAMASYRLWLMDKGTALNPGSGKKSKGVSEEVREEAKKAEGKLTAGQALRHRIRYFIDGAAIGDATFVERIFVLKRAIFGEKRKSGARPIRGAAFGELKVLRDLRKAAIT